MSGLGMGHGPEAVQGSEEGEEGEDDDDLGNSEDDRLSGKHYM